MIPTTEVVEMELNQIIAVSNFDENLGDSGSDGENALSRDGGFWDDEEE